MDADLLKYTFLANALLITEHQLTGRTERGAASLYQFQGQGMGESGAEVVPPSLPAEAGCDFYQPGRSFTVSSGHNTNVVQVKCTVTSAGHLPSIIGRRESRD